MWIKIDGRLINATFIQSIAPVGRHLSIVRPESEQLNIAFETKEDAQEAFDTITFGIHNNTAVIELES